MEAINDALQPTSGQFECIGIVDMFGFEQAQRNDQGPRFLGACW